MERITDVRLIGFKGRADATYRIAPATVLAGRNGIGKSACLEAIVYALTGKVPAGRKLDLVAAYFPPRGGSVRIVDAAGRWIERGIKRSGTKISESLSTSDDTPEGTIDLSRWQVSEVVLDVREFLALSAERRREYILQLCGGGTPAEDLGEQLELGYAQEIGGKGASCDWLDGADEALARAWRRARGLRETLASFLTAGAIAGKSLSEVFLKLGEAATEGKLGARRAAQEAAAAIAELEAEARGARAAAEEINARRLAVEAAREEMSAYRARAARRDEAMKRRDAATKKHEAAGMALEAAHAAAETAIPSGPRPEAPAQDTRKAQILDQIAALKAQIDEVRPGIAAGRGLLDARRRAEERRAVAGDTLARVQKMPLGRAMAILEEIPDEADPAMPELRAAVTEAAAGVEAERLHWLQAFDEAQVEYTRAANAATGAAERLAELEATEQKHEATIDCLREGLARVEAELSAGEGAYRKRLEAWETIDHGFRMAVIRLHGAQAAMDAARAELLDAQKRLDAIAAANEEAFPLMEEVETKLHQAEEAARVAEEAAGAVAAYESATLRAEQARTDEQAWKAAEAAIRTLRERVVGDSTAGLVDEINAVLRAAGREEAAYLTLESERGKPVFDLGWIAGGARVSIVALSAGQAVLFLAALSIALTRRSPGRRVLLIEADPLDTANLEALLRALGPQAKDFEAVLVATAAAGWQAPAGWQVVQLEAAARAKEGKAA